MDYIGFYLRNNLSIIENFVALVRYAKFEYDPVELQDYDYDLEEMTDISDWHYYAYYSAYDYIVNSGVPDVKTAINRMADQVLKNDLNC